METEKNSIEQIKNLEWERQNEKYKFLRNKDYSIEDYIKENKINLEEAYKKEGDEIIIGCIDEGMKEMGGRIPLAGSGLLFLTEQELLDFIKNRKADVITTHVGCGAALIWARKKNPNISQEDADKLAMKYIQNIATKAGIQYKHIFNEEMARPKEYHNARMVFYNNVKEYYPSRITELPPAFSVERFTMFQPKNAEKRIGLAITIAFNEHGFGEKFTKDEPFIIVCCLNENDNFNEIQNEVNSILDKMEIERQRIKIDYFVVSDK